MSQDDYVGISEDKNHETDGVYAMDEGDDIEHSTFSIETSVVM